MSADRPLAEIVAEGRRLQIKPGQKVFNERQTFFLYEHGPRLLAVAAAAMEWEQADDEYVNAEPAVQMRRLLDAETALRAAVRGESAAGAREGEGHK